MAPISYAQLQQLKLEREIEKQLRLAKKLGIKLPEKTATTEQREYLSNEQVQLSDATLNDARVDEIVDEICQDLGLGSQANQDQLSSGLSEDQNVEEQLRMMGIK